MRDYMTTEVITFLFFLYDCNDRKQGNFSFQFKRIRMEKKACCLLFAGFLLSAGDPEDFQCLSCLYPLFFSPSPPVNSLPFSFLSPGLIVITQNK